MLALLGLAAGCDSSNGSDVEVGPIATVVTATGEITPKVAEYRTLLGEPKNGGAVGPQAAGRREIGWDGVPANFNNGNNLFPGDFFNTITKLGAIFTTPGTGFRNDSTRFTGVNPGYGDQFNFFSANKIFAAVGSNLIDVTFRVPGTTTAALVSGFGAVFSDVDTPAASHLDYYGADGRLLGHYDAPVRSDAGGLSFLGVKYDSIAVARVRITLGQGAMGAGINDVSAGGSLDLVALDDFLYGEPQPAQ
ncbi:MAG TPA: hypothetical protein VHR41_07075 [Gemmatimonadales bacterium]|jgi:hypothetical protein|nr:hypothetical protein [Gemmatimonadales bacterium]